ncbi:MAG: site-specific integrase, partial [Candidatus Bathyarchaeota archaeon]|nr:site-specific integrase [Candidatus Bathyarchaeota archaeon]
MYNERDRRVVTHAGKTPKEDESRVRRLEEGEEEKIRTALATREPYMLCIFDLALESAMRMREMYTLGISQVDFDELTIFLDKTKNGDPRQVPMTTVTFKLLKKYIKDTKPTDNLFQFWDGKLAKSALNITSSTLSQKFSRAFKDAGCENLHFHDLRHEATSRLFERTNLSDAEIMKITGHKGIRMLLRYANL